MAGDVLLDTNIVIAFLANESDVVANIKTTHFFISSTVIGELYAGAYKSVRAMANVARIDALVTASAILSCDAATAKFYGNIKEALRAKGRPIPENDIWIAAVAHQYELILISRDEHFSYVDQLLIEKW